GHLYENNGYAYEYTSCAAILSTITTTTPRRSFMFNRVAFCLLLLVAAFRQPVQADENQVVEFTPDGAWCFFQDPRAVFIEGDHRRTFAQWMTREGALVVGSYDHDSGEILHHTLKPQW